MHTLAHSEAFQEGKLTVAIGRRPGARMSAMAENLYLKSILRQIPNPPEKLVNACAKVLEAQK